jgi:hypothetical protein
MVNIVSTYFMTMVSSRWEVKLSMPWPFGKVSTPPSRFDIFSGQLEKGANWLETVEDLDTARRRIKEIAGKEPGVYFVFSADSRSIVAKIE